MEINTFCKNSKRINSQLQKWTNIVRSSSNFTVFHRLCFLHFVFQKKVVSKTTWLNLHKMAQTSGKYYQKQLFIGVPQQIANANFYWRNLISFSYVLPMYLSDQRYPLFYFPFEEKTQFKNAFWWNKLHVQDMVPKPPKKLILGKIYII